MTKLIIQHGDRVTEHAVGPGTVVVGRDPSCDLFFADRKLSRRHARIERDGDSIRLVDLGSRNGSWVNEKRVADKVLAPGDTLRLGSLRIQVEPQTGEGLPTPTPEVDTADESGTVILTGDGVKLETAEQGTVALPRIPADAPVAAATMADVNAYSPDDSSTMILGAEGAGPATADQSGTVMLPVPGDAVSPAKPSAESEESGTVMLPVPDQVSQPSASGAADESGTVMLPVPDEVSKTADPQPGDESGTVMLPSLVSSESKPPLEQDAPGAAGESGTVMLPVPDGVDSMSGPDVADQSGTVILPVPTVSSETDVDAETADLDAPELPSAEDSATMMLGPPAVPSEASPDESGTVILEVPKELNEPEPSADDSRTVVLSKDSVPPPGSEPVVLPAPEDRETDEARSGLESSEPPEAVEEDKTVIATGARRRRDQQTSAFVLRGRADPSIEPAPPAPAIPSAEDDPQDEPASYSSSDDPSAEALPPPSGGSSLRFVALVAVVSLLAFAGVALPLLRTMGGALDAEAALRGRLLVDLLASENVAALLDSRADSLSIDRVANEPGVLAAFLLDPAGESLLGNASSQTGPLDGLGANARDIRAFRKSELSDGRAVFATPIMGDGRRVGVAVVHFQPSAARPAGTAFVLALGSALLLMGMAACVYIARRWTLAPVHELQADIEALQDGVFSELPEERPYSELSAIARGFNELLSRAPSSRDSDEGR